MEFELVQGVSAENISNIHSAYSVTDNSISIIAGGELMPHLISDLIKQLEEPVFFFLELPCSDDEERKLRKLKTDPMHYNLYYFDNCTLPVAEAIMKRYGHLLINDGLCRFGFGSHNSEEEIYCLKYQMISVYGDTSKFEECLKRQEIIRETGFLTLWDTFSNETPGICSSVEINGETVYDIVENLKPEGMYHAGFVEE